MGKVTNSEFDQKVSKVWPIIISTKDQIQVIPEQFNHNFNTLTTCAQSLGLSQKNKWNPNPPSWAGKG